MQNRTDAPILLPAKLPNEFRNVSVDSDLDGDEYGILFTTTAPDDLVRSFAHFDTIATLAAIPTSEVESNQYFEPTSTESFQLSDGSLGELRYMEPVREGGTYGPYWEGTFDKDGYTYSLSTISDTYGKDIVEQALSTMAQVKNPAGGVAEEPTTPSTQLDSEEERLEEFGQEYDAANRRGDWEQTYSMLDELSQQYFTEEEWAEKQQVQRDANGPPAPLQSISVDQPEGVSDSSANVILYYQDGTSDTIVAGIPMAVTSEEEAGEPKRTLSEEEISYLEQVSTDGDTDDLEAQAEEAAGDYYRAAGLEDWVYTYDALDSETQGGFTREEWSQKNQWFADNGTTIYNIESVNLDDAAQEPLAEVAVRLTGEDGSSSVRYTYFVYEDGLWKHRFGQEEYDLFMPDASYEEFVEAQ